jgi:hypothetical protein
MNMMRNGVKCCINTHYLCNCLKVPRLMVNVVEVLEMKALRKIKKDAICNFFQKYAIN